MLLMLPDALSPIFEGAGAFTAMFSWGTNIRDCVARSALTEDRAAEGAWRGLLTFSMFGPSLHLNQIVE